MLLQFPLECDGATSGELAATGTTVAIASKATNTIGIKNLRIRHLPCSSFQHLSYHHSKDSRILSQGGEAR